MRRSVAVRALAALLWASVALPKDSFPVFIPATGTIATEMAPTKGKGFELALPKGWAAMEGIGPDMKKGDEFKIFLEWPGIPLTGKVQDTSGYKIFGIEFGNLRAVFHKPGKGGVLIVFSSSGGTKGSLPEGIQRYLNAVVPDNNTSSGIFRVKGDENYPQIQFHSCKLVKQGEAVTFEAMRGWSWSFWRMYTFVAFYPTDSGPDAVTKAEKDQTIRELFDLVCSMK
jgi:hypothetical protein